MTHAHLASARSPPLILPRSTLTPHPFPPSILSIPSPPVPTDSYLQAFGDGRCLRISYAESLETLATAMDCMEKGIEALK